MAANNAITSQWLEETMGRILSFRSEQESKLVASANVSNSSSGVLLRPNPAVYQPKMILNNKNNKDSTDFFDLIDKSILIVTNSIVNSSCWPLALITFSISAQDDKRERTVDLGALDCHGSIWKMILRPDAYPGTRIILQTNEIGETPSYLRADLTFHESIEVAAVWTVFTVSNLNQSADSNDDSTTATKLPSDGIIVRFELFEGPSGYGIRSEGRYLVSVIAKDLSKGIALMTESEMKNDKEKRELSFGVQWELICEDVEIPEHDVDLTVSA